MFDKMHTVELSGEIYLIKCDMVVLEQLQEIYGDLEEFEKRIITSEVKRDEDGNEIVDEEGKKKIRIFTPDAKAVNDGLYLMISEGLEIEEKETIGRKALLRKIDKNIYQLGNIVHNEFMECFRVTKNEKTTQNQQTEKE